MSEIDSPVRGKIAALEASMRGQTKEQFDAFLAAISTSHEYADGMYCRIVARDKGVTIVGKVHKREHFYIVAKGSVAVSNGDDEPKVYTAGTVIVSRPGTKRAVVALEDSICMTVHRNATDTRDLDQLETELVEPDPLAMFDSQNRMKELK